MINKFLFFLVLGLILPHGVSDATVSAMSNASLVDYIYFGGEHMVTGYDHLLFLVGVIFFLGISIVN